MVLYSLGFGVYGFRVHRFKRPERGRGSPLQQARLPELLLLPPTEGVVQLHGAPQERAQLLPVEEVVVVLRQLDQPPPVGDAEHVGHPAGVARVPRLAVGVAPRRLLLAHLLGRLQ